MIDMSIVSIRWSFQRNIAFTVILSIECTILYHHFFVYVARESVSFRRSLLDHLQWQSFARKLTHQKSFVLATEKAAAVVSSSTLHKPIAFNCKKSAYWMYASIQINVSLWNNSHGTLLTTILANSLNTWESLKWAWILFKLFDLYV